LILVALLALGATLVLTGSTLSATVLSFMRS
jgi:3-oxoacyl-ACP reductase-like protein